MQFPHANWRLIHSQPARGAWNMALDEAILEAVGRGDAPPTLRLYAWAPPCLSLGYAQPSNDVDQQQLARLGWDLVRRPTGGRAILHTDELTYAVITPADEARLAGGVLESYRRLAQALDAALQALGIPTRPLTSPETTARDQPPDPVCFDTPSNYEITWQGKKLIGSAQTRRLGGILQHGTFPLRGDLTRITRVLRYQDETQRAAAATKLLQKAATAEAVLGAPLAWEAAARAFAAAFAEQLNLTLTPGNPSPQELARAHELEAQKYSHPSWTKRL